MTPGWIGLGRDRGGARPCAPTQNPAKRGIWIQGICDRPAQQDDRATPVRQVWRRAYSDRMFGRRA
jgi:hypothetical protein